MSLSTLYFSSEEKILEFYQIKSSCCDVLFLIVYISTLRSLQFSSFFFWQLAIIYFKLKTYSFAGDNLCQRIPHTVSPLWAGKKGRYRYISSPVTIGRSIIRYMIHCRRRQYVATFVVYFCAPHCQRERERERYLKLLCVRQQCIDMIILSTCQIIMSTCQEKKTSFLSCF